MPSRERLCMRAGVFCHQPRSSVCAYVRSRHGAHGRRGFSLAELLIVIGVVSLLLGLALPRVAKTREMARASGSLNNVRSYALSVFAYGQDYQELPPVLFSTALPTLSSQAGEGEAVVLAGQRLLGDYFSNPYYAHLAFSTPHPAASLWEPGSPQRDTITIAGVHTALSPDYHLTGTLYAAAEFWRLGSSQDKAMWVPQRLSAIVAPAQKGLVSQDRTWQAPGTRDLHPAIRMVPPDYPVAHAFADGAAINLAPASVLPGILNVWALPPGSGNPSAEVRGIDFTLDGVRGRDR